MWIVWVEIKFINLMMVLKFLADYFHSSPLTNFLKDKEFPNRGVHGSVTAPIPKDVILLIFKHAASLDYDTCCNLRLTARWAASSLAKQQYLWCLHKGLIHVVNNGCRIETAGSIEEVDYTIDISNLKFNDSSLGFSIHICDACSHEYWGKYHEMTKKVEFSTHGNLFKERIFYFESHQKLDISRSRFREGRFLPFTLSLSE